MMNIFKLYFISALAVLPAFDVLAVNSNLSCKTIFTSQNPYIRKDVDQDLFIKDRVLVEYVMNLYSYAGFRNGLKGTFQFSFAHDLNRLTKDSLIIDFGDGDGTALTGLFQTPRHFKSEGKKWFKSELNTESQLAYTRFIFSLISARSSRFWTLIKDTWLSVKQIWEPFYDSQWRPLDPNFLIHSKNAEKFLSRPIEERPNALGISFSRTENELVKNIPSLTRLTNRLFEEIPLHEIPPYQLGVSYLGIFSYTSLLSQSLFKAITKLETGGHLYIFGMKSFVEIEKGEIVPISKFLQKYGKGFNVYTRNIKDTSIVVIEKHAEDIQLPELKYLTDDGSFPPVFKFQMTSQFEK
jgi:hypothetical protein